MNFGQGMAPGQLDPNVRKQIDDYLQQRMGAQSLSQGPSGAAASLSQPFSSGATPSPMTTPMARSFATGGMVKSGKSRGDGCITKGGTKGRIV